MPIDVFQSLPDLLRPLLVLIALFFVIRYLLGSVLGIGSGG